MLDVCWVPLSPMGAWYLFSICWSISTICVRIRPNSLSIFLLSTSIIWSTLASVESLSSSWLELRSVFSSVRGSFKLDERADTRVEIKVSSGELGQRDRLIRNVGGEKDQKRMGLFHLIIYFVIRNILNPNYHIHSA